ncbi:hypothetical protein Mal64_24070 [Pseudobythopirellula maris]|uniref:Uncharacterized protein n=1 Tax=Pseudobythopirellula maris TaxID=2527991 RepID=A0A5C5ZPS8_9BACT|nr:hypothetical protein [Pseudobythopirellula maris]TWT88917.1 hypothetical protein Mal64_24070 [Pseudobythopirellula maris]
MKHYMNLTTPQHRLRRETLRLVRLWVWLFVVLAGAGAMAILAQSVRSDQIQREMLAAEARFEPSRVLMHTTSAKRTELSGLLADESEVLELSTKPSPVTLLGRVSQAAAACDGQLRVRELQLMQPSVAAGAPGRLMLQAEAIVGFDPEIFLRALKRPPLDSVELIESGLASENGAELQTLDIECRFQP